MRESRLANPNRGMPYSRTGINLAASPFTVPAVLIQGKLIPAGVIGDGHRRYANNSEITRKYTD